MPQYAAHTKKFAHLRVLIVMVGALVACSGDSNSITAPTSTSSGTSASISPIVASVSVSAPSLTATLGRSTQFSAQARTASGDLLAGQSVLWTSSDSTIATVSSGGVAVGVGIGAVSITATAANGIAGVANLAVGGAPAIAALTVSPAQVSAGAGQTTRFSVTLQDAAGNVLTGRRVIWSSSNPAIMRVDSTGTGTPIGQGSVTISAVSAGMSNTAIAAVSAVPVQAPAAVTDLTVVSTTDTSATLQFTQVNNGAGGPASYDVHVGVPPTDFTSSQSVSNGSCKTPVSGTGPTGTFTCTVYGLTPATTLNFQLVAFSGILNVNAVYGPLSNVSAGSTTATVGSVTVSPATSTLSTGAAGTQLTAALRDARGNAISGQLVSWSSSNSAVATVSSTGVVTGVSAGSATITAAAGSASGTATITVTSSAAQPSPPPATPTATAPVASVTVSPGIASMVAGSGSVQFSAVLKDANGNVLSGRTVSFSSSNTGVAGISANGLASGVAAGTSTITATSESVSATATLTVTAAVAPPQGGILAIATPPGNTTSGQSFPAAPIVQLRTTANALMSTSSAPVTVTIASGSGTLSGNTTVSAVAGVATFSNLAITGSGSFTLAFASPGFTRATSTTFAVTAPAATQLVIVTQPGTATAGAVLSAKPVVQVRNASNGLVGGSSAPVTVTIASGPGTLSGTATVNASNGVATFPNLALSTPGTYTLAFSSAGLTGATSSSVLISAPSTGGGSTAITLSRDGGSSAGGAKVTITGSGFAADAVVKFAGVSATSVTFVNATTLNVVVPAGTATNLVSPTAVAVSVATGGTTSTLANAWTYWPAPTNILGTADFETGMNGTGGLGPCCATSFGDGSYIGVSTDHAHSGSQSLKQTAAETQNNWVSYQGSWQQTDLFAPAGRWHRYYIYVPAATMASVINNGQIKLFLSRTATSNFVVTAIGANSFGGGAFATANDYGNNWFNLAPYGSAPYVTPDMWHEVQIWEYRDTTANGGTGLGYARVWFDGKLISDSQKVWPMFVPSLANMGNNNASEYRDARFGLVYTELALSYPITIYLDDVAVGNGYFDPP